MPEDDDLDIVEITDLPDLPANRPHVIALARFLSARPALRSRLWWPGTMMGLALLLALVILSSFPNWQDSVAQLLARPTPTPTPVIQINQSSGVVIPPDAELVFRRKKELYWRVTTPPLVPLNWTLAMAPTTCRGSTSTQNFDGSNFPPAVGGSPLWIVGFDGPRAALKHLKRATPPQYGWSQQLLLITPTNFSGSITLTGGTMGNIAPLWFSTATYAKRVMSIVVRPLDSSLSNHTIDDQQWNITPVNIYITRADCYYLHAVWPGGSWVVFFAAGRWPQLQKLQKTDIHS